MKWYFYNYGDLKILFQNDVGLIPRICESLFSKMTDEDTNYRTEVR